MRCWKITILLDAYPKSFFRGKLLGLLGWTTVIVLKAKHKNTPTPWDMFSLIGKYLTLWIQQSPCQFDTVKTTCIQNQNSQNSRQIIETNHKHFHPAPKLLYSIPLPAINLYNPSFFVFFSLSFVAQPTIQSHPNIPPRTTGKLSPATRPQRGTCLDPTSQKENQTSKPWISGFFHQGAFRRTSTVFCEGC